MDWQYLLTSTEGRINRRPFWFGILLLLVASIVVNFIVSTVVGTSLMGAAASNGDPDAMRTVTVRSAWASLISFAILAFPSYALMVKRRQDRGGSSQIILVYLVLSAVSYLMQALWIDYTIASMGGIVFAQPGFLSGLFSLVIGVLSIYLIVVLGFLRGTPGPNAYGPDPLQA